MLKSAGHFIGTMPEIVELVFANQGKPDADSGVWFTIYSSKWIVTALLGLGFAATLVL